MTPEAENFIKYNFATTQDLCKQFITVVSAILVFSLTFSEKIVNFPTATPMLRVLLGISWAALLFSIIACGLGLTYICIAGGQAVYGGNSFNQTALTSYQWIIVAGCSFVGALLCLICIALTRTIFSH